MRTPTPSPAVRAAPLVAAALLAILAVSCTRTPSPVSPSTAPSSPGPEVTVTPGVPVTDYSSFIENLKAAGYTVRPGERTEGDQLFRSGQVVCIDGARVSTYEYPSEGALDRWRSGISEDGYSVPTRGGGVAMVEWVDPPHFYTAGTLLVLYIGDDRAILDGLGSLLGDQVAGP